ncbi:MAG: M18 family aminopeptidase [Firmicutes bacterium]|nr:M18 family aminopeptidase [Bacillota bacterium]
MGFLDYVNASPTAFHAAQNAARILSRGGYSELREGKGWKLEKGGKYYMVKDNSAVAAFAVGEDFEPENGVRIIAAHTDSPGIAIKPGASLSEAACVKLNTECYGGLILPSWLDRPLSLAGLVMVKDGGTGETSGRLVDIGRPLTVIPNVAIHLNKELNEGYKYDKREMKPVLALVSGEMESGGRLERLLRRELGGDAEILDFELFLYDSEKGCLFGADDEFVSSARLDDLWMVWAGLEALTNGELCKKNLSVLLCFDNEEIGSVTPAGAGSFFARNALERFASAFSRDGERDAFFRMCANGTAISADLTHALHPNSPGLHDEAVRPVLGGGPVVKLSANRKYATGAPAAAMFRDVCKNAGVPCQTFVYRSDMPGGTTLGPLLASALVMPTADVGAPVLGMHSIRETGAVRDGEWMAEAFKGFYEQY